MMKRRNPYLALFLSILLIFLYVILFIFIIFKYNFASVLMDKFIWLFKNKEMAEALFGIIFFVFPVSLIFVVFNRKV